MNPRHARRAGLYTLLLGFGCAFAGCSDDASIPSGPAGTAGKGGAGTAGKGGAGTAGKGGSSSGNGGSATAGKGGSSGSSQGGETAAGAPSETSAGAAGEMAQGGAPGGGEGGRGGDGGANEAGAPGAAGDGAGGESGVLKCGSAPYARASVSGNVLLDHPDATITVTASACPDETLLIEDPTVATTQGTPELFDLPSLTPLHLKATQPGSYPSLGAEFMLDAGSILYDFFDALPAGVLMAANTIDFTLLVPAYAPSTHAVIYVQTAKADGGTADCASTAGVTYTVMDHAETVAKYSGNGTATGDGGDGGVTLIITTAGTLAAPELVTVLGTKAGCSVKTTGFAAGGAFTGQTGKLPVAAGATSGFLVAAVGN
jgi:hypothetical protein